MKTIKRLLLSALMAILPLSANAASTICMQSLSGASGIQFCSKYGNCYTTDSNGQICVATGDVSGAANAGFINLGSPQATVAFNSAMYKNPLMMVSYNDVPTDVLISGLQSTAAQTLIASVSGRQIIPTGGITILASGTAATATGIALECSDGTLIASWPIGGLVDGKPVGIQASTFGAVTTAAALTKGCAAGKALQISNVGANLTTTTHLYVSIPYIAY